MAPQVALQNSFFITDTDTGTYFSLLICETGLGGSVEVRGKCHPKPRYIRRLAPTLPSPRPAAMRFIQLSVSLSPQNSMFGIFMSNDL